jgi:putative Holliday junction resolvase
MDLANKRIAAIDYGTKRIGLAYTDELHISINPKDTIDNNEKKWDKLERFFQSERIAAVVVGIPYTADGNKTEWIETIENFIAELKEKFNLPVYTQDESSSSDRALNYMIASGVKKKKRGQKGNLDKMAAGVILGDFLSNM